MKRFATNVSSSDRRGSATPTGSARALLLAILSLSTPRPVDAARGSRKYECEMSPLRRMAHGGWPHRMVLPLRRRPDTARHQSVRKRSGDYVGASYRSGRQESVRKSARTEATSVGRDGERVVTAPLGGRRRERKRLVRCAHRRVTAGLRLPSKQYYVRCDSCGAESRYDPVLHERASLPERIARKVTDG